MIKTVGPVWPARLVIQAGKHNLQFIFYLIGNSMFFIDLVDNKNIKISGNQIFI